MKKADKSANFAAGGIINCRTQHNSIYRDKNKHYVTSNVMVYKAMTYATLSCTHELCRTPTLVAQNKRRLLSKQPSHKEVAQL
jgi:hypothetical protein